MSRVCQRCETPKSESDQTLEDSECELCLQAALFVRNPETALISDSLIATQKEINLTNQTFHDALAVIIQECIELKGELELERGKRRYVGNQVEKLLNTPATAANVNPITTAAPGVVERAYPRMSYSSDNIRSRISQAVEALRSGRTA